MFSRSKITDTSPSTEASKDMDKSTTPNSRSSEPGFASDSPSDATQTGPKPSPSVLSSDLTIKGNVITSGDVQVEGTVEGDVHAHLLTIGESATVKGEIVGDDVVVHGRVIGRLRGLKVRLTASARVEGDIVHKTIAIESGAHFEGSVQRQEDPIGDTTRRASAPQASSASASASTSSSPSSSPSSSTSSSTSGAASAGSSTPRPRTETREPAAAGASGGGSGGGSGGADGSSASR